MRADWIRLITAAARLPARGGVRSFVLTVFWQKTAVLNGAMMTVEKNPVPTELIDALLANYKKPEDLIGQNGILKQLT